MEEVWKVVEGFSMYGVSSLGQIRDFTTKELRPLVLNGGFLCTNMYNDSGKKVLCKVHRLVASNFLDNPENAHNVVHKDGCKENNSVGNLYWKAKITKVTTPKQERAYNWFGDTKTASEISTLTGTSEEVIKRRYYMGWSCVEVKLGYKMYTESGYQNETHWFPTKSQMEEHEMLKRFEENEKIRLERLSAKALARAEKKAQVHCGFGVFVNYPIKGIENRKTTRTYYVWQGIISRCYNPNHDSYARYGGRGCTVSEKWKHFQDFASWYEEQQKRGIGNAHVNWHVDKDILFEGNLEYGPDTCCFVPDEVNTFFVLVNDSVKGYFLNKGRWTASITIFGNKNQRGFDTEEEARNWYKQGKSNAAKLLMWKYGGLLDQRVMDKLSRI
jgi:hypothetical protein